MSNRSPYLYRKAKKRRYYTVYAILDLPRASGATGYTSVVIALHSRGSTVEKGTDSARHVCIVPFDWSEQTRSFIFLNVIYCLKMFSMFRKSDEVKALEEVAKLEFEREFEHNLFYTRKGSPFGQRYDWGNFICQYYSYDCDLIVRLLREGAHWAQVGKYYNDDIVCFVKNFQEATKWWDDIPTEDIPGVLHEIKYHNRVYHPGRFGVPDSTCSCYRRYTRNDLYIHTIIPANLPAGLDFEPSDVFDHCSLGFEFAHKMNIYIPLMLTLIKRVPSLRQRFLWKLMRVAFSYYWIFKSSESKADKDWDWHSFEKLIMRTGPVYPCNVPQYICDHHLFERIDGKQFKDMVYWFETAKHHVQAQGGTCQSVSATLFDPLVDMVQQHLQAQVNVNIKLTEQDEFFGRFEQTLTKVQDSFVESLKESIGLNSVSMTAMFVIVVSVGLLGYTVVKFGSHIVKETLNLVYKSLSGSLFRDSDVAESQSDGSWSIPALPAIILKNVINPPAEIMSKVWNCPDIDKVMRRIGYLGDPKVFNGVGNLTNWVKNLVHKTIRWYMQTFIGIEMAEDIDSTCSPVETWYNDCDKFLESYWKKEMEWNEVNWSILMNLYGRGMALTRQRVFEAHKNDIWRIIYRLGNLLEKFNSHGRTGASVRNPPVTLYMQGDTGVGKSSVTYPISAAILKGIYQKESGALDLADYWKNLIYMRSAEQEFWDGYENQLVTVFDDFSQMVDSSGRPNTELFEVIRASNSFPYPLHMASLDQKATTNFTSKIIIVSSNLDQPKTVSLNFPEALYRRFDLAIHVSRKPGVVVKPGVFDPNIYRFQRYDMSTLQPLEDLTYNEVIYFAVTEYFKRKGFVDSMDQYIRDSFKENADVAEAQGLFVDMALKMRRGVNYCKETAQRGSIEIEQATTVLRGGDPTLVPFKNALTLARKELEKVRTTWSVIKEVHPYIAKSLKFCGLLAVVLGTVKLFSMFSGNKKKEPKIMSLSNFKKLVRKQSHYSMDDIDAYIDDWMRPVTRADLEGYTDIKQPVPRVEAYADVKVQVPRVEGASIKKYDPVEVGHLNAEGHPYMIMCPHELAEKHKGGSFQVPLFLTSCGPTCPRKLLPEGISDLNSSEILSSVVQNNLYKLVVKETGIAIGHGFFIRGRIFVCPRHYLVAFKKLHEMKGTVVFRSAFLTRGFEELPINILNSYRDLESPEIDSPGKETRDIMAFPVKTATFHANIVPHISDKENLSYVYTSTVVLPTICETTGKNKELPYIGMMMTTGRSRIGTIASRTIQLASDPLYYRVRNMWEYRMDTRVTNCGAPLLAVNKMVTPGKIIGLHVAGLPDDGVGYSSPFHKEDAERIVAMFPEYDSIEFRVKGNYKDPVPEAQSSLPSDAEFVRLGTVDRPVAQPSKSKVVPSPVHGMIREPITKPCALKPVMVEGDMFCPRMYRLRKLGNVSKPIPDRLLSAARNAVFVEMRKQMWRVDMPEDVKAVYCFEDAVNGIDGSAYVNSIKRSTSPGYPFVHENGFETRKKIFGEGEKCDTTTPEALELRRRVMRIIDNARQGVVEEHIFMDTLKDERKPIEKAHKTRLFSAGPLDYLVACKMYFNGVVAAIQYSRNFNHVAVGTDPHTEDWNVMAHELLYKSPWMVAGDFEGFDASQSMQMLEAAGEILVELSKSICKTRHCDVTIMRTLLIPLFNSVHINGNEIYRWTHSLPSGHYLTAIINSIFVLLAFNLSWMLAVEDQLEKEDECFALRCFAIKKKNKYTALNQMGAHGFFAYCGLVAYGDDHILSVPYFAKGWFNQRTIPKYMEMLGLTYTMETKEAVNCEIRELREISFLKRGFVFDAERMRWVAPLSLDTILESPMWNHKCADPRAQTIEQIEGQIRELAIHPKEVWDKWFPIMESCLASLEHITIFSNYDDIRSMVLGL